MNVIKENNPYAPWDKYYSKIDMNFDIPDTSFYQYFENKVSNYKSLYCFDYYGTKFKYYQLLEMIDDCSKGFYSYGVRKGDIVTICLPNVVEAIVAFFALNKIGAVANFMHPLSSENEIKDFLNETNSKIVILLDSDFEKYNNIKNDIRVKKVIFVDVYNYMPIAIKLMHKISSDKRNISNEDDMCILWCDFIAKSRKIIIDNYVCNTKKNDPCLILHSGGTTGTPKGVLLSNYNIMMYIESDIKLSPDLGCGDIILAVIPIFHGFGLVSNVLFSLCMGMLVVLMCKFDVNDYCRMIKKHKPQCLSGVPSLFDAVFNKLKFTSCKLDHLKYVVSGGDVLNPCLRDKIDNILKEKGSSAKVTVGYGLTEAVCAVVIESKYITFKENTVGIPFPGVYVGIFSKENKELPYGEEGEICINGPTVMLGYYNNKKDTDVALQKHEDGNVWLHTGDMGKMDKDGYLTYISRKDRMFISSGYNIYPNQIEKILELHKFVKSCVVVDILHEYKSKVPKAYIVLNEEYKDNKFIVDELKIYCDKNLPKYACPYEYEFIEKIPVTNMGKIDYNSLKYKSK